jgi:hypothetical protein
MVPSHRRPSRRGIDDVSDETVPAVGYTGDRAGDPVTLRAHAKLTLGLRITGVRDDGYHLIDAEMVSLDLHDLVTLTPGPCDSSATSTPSACTSTS